MKKLADSGFGLPSLENINNDDKNGHDNRSENISYDELFDCIVSDSDVAFEEKLESLQPFSLVF